MDREEISAELNNVIGNYLKARGLELVELIYRYEGKNLVLRILVDRPEGGIRLDECAGLNSEISVILDEKEILRTGYILEVFSPGLDRPLRARGDFLRCLKRKIKFFLNEPLDGKIELDGILDSVGDDAVYVRAPGGLLNIPFSKINKAKQIISCI